MKKYTGAVIWDSGSSGRTPGVSHSSVMYLCLPREPRESWAWCLAAVPDEGNRRLSFSCGGSLTWASLRYLPQGVPLGPLKAHTE